MNALDTNARRGDFFHWRILATGFSFAVFGIGGLLLGLLVFPALALLTPEREARTRRCRKVVHYAFRLFVRMMRALGILTWSARGAERLQGEGKLIIANHPTLLDIVFLIALIPNATCIVKASLFRNVFTRGPVAWAGYIPNGSPEELLRDCERELRRGANLIVFPEGTRTVQGKALRFKRGAAYIWLRSDCDLVLAALDSAPPTLQKNAGWYKVPHRRFHFSIDARTAGEIGGAGSRPEALAAAGDGAAASNRKARSVNRRWQDYFSKTLFAKESSA